MAYIKGSGMTKISTCKDISLLRGLIKEWRDECLADDFGIVIDMEEVEKDFIDTMKGRNSAMLLMTCDDYENDSPAGFIGIRMFKNPLGHEMIANEHYWFVGKQYRGRRSIYLLNAAKDWAKINGCKLFMSNASCLASRLHDQVCALYENTGMKKFETTYIMQI